MSKITEAIAIAKRWAFDPAHGYDQNLRWGPDYDCSSFLISVWEEAGVPVKGMGATWTGNMRGAFLRAGFVDVTAACELNMGAGLEAGDILINESYHTEMYLGDGNLVGASSNEFGGITGGQTGDQTGNEIRIRPWYRYSHGWDCVLRYAGEQEVNVTPLPFGEPAAPVKEPVDEYVESNGSYIVKPGDGWWKIAAEQLGNGSLMYDLAAVNGMTIDTMLHPGMTIRLWDDNCPTCKVDPEPLEDDVASIWELKRYLEAEVAKLGGRILWDDPTV